jgi:predicted N-acetyltransferase YhbS
VALRATEDERDLLAQGRLAALRVLAEREQFVLDADGQKEWERINSRQAHGTGTTRVFVVTEVDQTHVVAYYAWCMASVAIQPSALLARLGVDERHEGHGLGADLMSVTSS